MIIAAVFSFLVHITFPLTSLVSKFSLKGDATDTIDQEGKNPIAACWCIILGLVVNVIHISMYEWYTSHGCPNVRNMVRATTKLDSSAVQRLSASFR